MELEESKVSAIPQVKGMPNEWVLPCLNRRSSFLYTTPLQIDGGIYSDQDGVKYTPQFFQGLIQVPEGEEIDFSVYTKKFARFYNKNVKENNFDHGVMCPISTLSLPTIFNLQRYVMFIYLYPSIRILDLAKGDFSYENMVPLMNRETGIEGFYQPSTLPNNTQEWWENLD